MRAAAKTAAACVLAIGIGAADARRSEEHWAEFQARFERTGETERCLMRHGIIETRVIDKRHILFRTGVSRYYLNTLPHECASLDHAHAIGIDTPTSNLCDIDSVKVLDPGFHRLPGGRLIAPACGFGEFERVEKRIAAD